MIGISLADKHDYASLINRIEQFDPSFINLNGNETLYNMFFFIFDCAVIYCEHSTKRNAAIADIVLC